MRAEADRERGLLHPVALLAIAILVINDHVLKARYAGWITGKLSDFAGLTFFPLLVVTLARPLASRLGLRGDRLLIAACATTAIGFAAIKLWSPATHACEWVLGALQWPFAAIANGALVALTPVTIVLDPTDLIAIPCVAIAWWIGRGARSGPQLGT